MKTQSTGALTLLLETRMHRLKFFLVMLASATFLFSNAYAQARDPRPVRFVVITSPGGSADLLARVLAVSWEP